MVFKSQTIPLSDDDDDDDVFYYYYFSSSAPVSSALSHRFTDRVVVIGAGIVTFSCLLAISQVSSFWHICALFPVLGKY